MTFAKEYREEITFAYYCVSCVLSILIFLVGAIYLPIYFNRRERRYQERKEERDQQRKEETEEIERRHQKMKEWRDFAETIRKEHNELKGKNIPSIISKVKNAFKKIHICKDINGTDVLRFMMRDRDHESFKTEKLDALREDLDSVYRLLNRCASLILLGRVSENVRAELGHLVTNLGLLTLPFYKGEERQIILTCLEHFGGVDNEVKREAEREGVKDEEIEGNVPYVRLLRFGDLLTGNEFVAAKSDSYTIGISSRTLGNRNDGDCNKFKFEPDLRMSVSCQPGFLERGLYNQLKEVHDDLEKEEYQSVFASKLREQTPSLNFIDMIRQSDPDELVIMKALHEIRVYIHRLTEGKPLEGRERELMKMHEGVKKIKFGQTLVHGLCDQFIVDLGRLKESCHPYYRDQTFSKKFEKLKREFDKLQKIPPSYTPKTYV